MDRGERRSRNLALMSRVGRAVAGTLRPQVAFRAIAAREVMDTLNLDGMALVPLGPNPLFAAYLAGEKDEPALRERLTSKVAADGKRVVLHGGALEASAAALPFGASQESSPVGVLL